MCRLLSSWSSAITQKLFTLLVVHAALYSPATARLGTPVEEDDVVDLNVFQVKPGDLDQSMTPDDPCADFSMGGSQLHKFSSPGFPRNYPPSLECIRTVNAPKGYDITVDFRGAYFEVEASYERPEGSVEVEGGTMNCPNDFLEIRDGKYGFSPLIGRFCGMRIPRRPVRAISGYMWMRFHSDDILEYRGFEAEYQFVRSPKDRQRHDIDCLITETAHHDGYIQTLHMHTFYEKFRNSTGNLECVWKVVSPTSDLQVRFFLRDFELGKPNLCHMNFMEVYSGTTADQPVRKFCGLTASNVATPSNIAYVRIFATGEAMQGLKIKYLFSTYTKNKNCTGQNLFSCGDDSCVVQQVVCNKRTNCLYRKDEHGCKFNELQMPKMLLPGAYMIILVVVCAVIVAVILCALVINYCPKFKRQQAKYDAFLKELASRPPPGITAEHRRHTIATMNPTHEQLLAAGFTTPIVDSSSGGRVKFFFDESDTLKPLTPSMSKRASTEPRRLPPSVDAEQQPGTGTAFIKENRFATVGTPVPILRKTWSKSGKRSLVEKPLLHRVPVDLDTDLSSSTMTMSRSAISGLSSALSNSRDQEDMEMTALHVGRAAPRRTPHQQQMQRGSGRRRTHEAPTPDLILNGILGTGQAPFASTSSSEGGGGKAGPSTQFSSPRKLVTFTGALDSSMDSGESEVCFPIQPGSSSLRHAPAVKSKRGGRPTASNLSHAYHDELIEEQQELLDKRSPVTVRKPSATPTALQLDYSNPSGPSKPAVKFVDSSNREVDRKDYPSRSFIARI